MGSGAAAHIYHFHIVVPVLWKVDEAGMGPDSNQPAAVQELFCVDDVGVSIHVDAALDGVAAGQQSLLLLSDRPQGTQKFFIDHTITGTHCTRSHPCLQCK